MKKQNSIYIALVIILLASLACNIGGSALAPSDTPAPTEPSIPAEPSAPTESSAPTDPLSSPLVGKWEGIDDVLGALIIEFKSDGVYEATASGPTFTLTYEMVDADTFILSDPSGLAEPSTVDFVRSGDTLTMTMDGSTIEFHKVP